MGLFSAIVMLPFAPVRGVAWVAEQVADEAERQLYDERRLRGQMLQLELDHDAGLVDEEEYEERTEQLLERINEARRRASGQTMEGEVLDGQ